MMSDVVQVPWSGWGEEVVNTAAHQALAKEAADQSITLLKNQANTLPLAAKTRAGAGMRVAVMGRNANATANMLGNYFGTAPYLISPLEGLGHYAKTSYNDGASIASAVAEVAHVDAVVSTAAGIVNRVATASFSDVSRWCWNGQVLVVGLLSDCSLNGKRAHGSACDGGKSDEAEGHDRTSLLLPGTQNALIAEVSAAAAKQRKPVVLVIMSGGPLDVTAAKMDRNVGAIVWCGYPGQSGGLAVADVLFGTTNPAGRLTLTWYPESFTKQAKITDMGMRPNPLTHNPGRSYRCLAIRPAPFVPLHR